MFRGKHDYYTDRKIGEMVLGTNLAQREKFEALDDNGNGKLSCSELKMGIFVLPCVSLSTFCPLACRKDIFYVCKGVSMWPAVLLDLPRV